MAALDKKLREETQFELVKIQESLGVTFVVVTHDQEEAMTLATRIGVMDAGKIVQIGEPRQIYEAPESRFVAHFIGSVNLFEGVVQGAEAGAAVIRSPDAGCDIRLDEATTAGEGQTVAVAIRPEKISITRERPAGTDNIAAGIVEDIAYMGDISIYRVMLDTGKRAQVTQPNLSRRAGEGVGWDERVWISWGASAGVVLTS